MPIPKRKRRSKLWHLSPVLCIRNLDFCNSFPHGHTLIYFTLLIRILHFFLRLQKASAINTAREAPHGRSHAVVLTAVILTNPEISSPVLDSANDSVRQTHEIAFRNTEHLAEAAVVWLTHLFGNSVWNSYEFVTTCYNLSCLAQTLRYHCEGLWIVGWHSAEEAALNQQCNTSTFAVFGFVLHNYSMCFLCFEDSFPNARSFCWT